MLAFPPTGIPKLEISPFPDPTIHRTHPSWRPGPPRGATPWSIRRRQSAQSEPRGDATRRDRIEPPVRRVGATGPVAPTIVIASVAVSRILFLAGPISPIAPAQAGAHKGCPYTVCGGSASAKVTGRMPVHDIMPKRPSDRRWVRAHVRLPRIVLTVQSRRREILRSAQNDRISSDHPRITSGSFRLSPPR